MPSLLSLLSLLSSVQVEAPETHAPDHRNLLHSPICILSWVLPPITERDARKHPTQCYALSPWRRKQEQERTEKTGKNTQKSKSIVSPFSLLPPVGLFIEHDESSFP